MMRRSLFANRYLAVVWMSCLVLPLVACSGDKAADPVVDELSVVIEPEDIVIGLGHVASIAAQVRGDVRETDRRVTFWSQDSAIVRVIQTSDAAATLIAAGLGTTTVVASAVARVDLRDSVRVRIGAVTIPTPSIFIAAMTTSSSSTPIDPANVTGRIDVRMEVYANAADRRVTLGVGSGSTVACGSAAADIVSVVCTFDTAEKDASGALRYPDGTYTLSARIVRPDGVVTASNNRQLTFKNATGGL